MQTDIIISGFGGQGVLFAGQLLSYAAMEEGLQVTWIPSYGPEMRGGTAHCTVFIADEEIGSPITHYPQVAIVMNLPSLDKYESLVKPGGILVVNTSLTNRNITRSDITVVNVAASEIAERMGEKRMANIALLGAFLTIKPIISLKGFEKALKDHLPTRHQKLFSLNLLTLQAGVEAASAHLK
jgi:2-oxoglutarate ferredoxin oxidoreductase subunit gamma